MIIENFFQYKMNDSEKLKADIADIFLNTFNGSYKPHCFGNIRFGFENDGNDGAYRTVYIENHGYTMEYIKDNGLYHLFEPFKNMLHPLYPDIVEKEDVKFIPDILEYMVTVAKGFGFDDCSKETICSDEAIIRRMRNIIYKNQKIYMMLNNEMKGFPENFIYIHFNRRNRLYEDFETEITKEWLSTYGFYHFQKDVWMVDL